MTDAQIIAIAITVLAIVSGVLVNNSRIGDMNSRIGDIHSRLDDVKETLRAETKAEISALRVEMNDRFNAIENKLDAILRMLADVDQRVTRLEARN
jgi:hypothetical protein